MVVDRIGTNVVDPDVWQQLNLATAETQNGIVLESSVQPYIGAHWREVEPFAVSARPRPPTRTATRSATTRASRSGDGGLGRRGDPEGRPSSTWTTAR
jgi:hypothetical protein